MKKFLIKVIKLIGDLKDGTEKNSCAGNLLYSPAKKRGLLFVVSIIAIILLSVWGVMFSKKSLDSGLPLIPPLKVIDQGSESSDSREEEFVIHTSWPDVPKRMVVYKKIPLPVNDNYINEIIKKFGIKPKSRDASDDLLTIYDQDMDLLDVHPNGFRYATYDSYDNQGINLPNDQKVEKMAVEYLKEKGFLPKDSFTVTTSVGSSMGRYDPASGREITTITTKNVILRRKLESHDDANSLISVEFGDNGKIVGVQVWWPEVKPVAEYLIITPQEAFDKLKRGEVVSENYLRGQIDEIYLAYLTHPDKENAASDYIQPVYVFRGMEDSAMVAAVQDKFVSGKSLKAKSQTVRVDRTKTIKQFAMPVPERIKQLKKGKVFKTFTHGEPEFNGLVDNIEKLLVYTRGNDIGSMANLEEVGNGNFDPWSKAREVINKREVFHVIFPEKIRISTSFAPVQFADKDRYGNYVIYTEHLFLVQVDPRSLMLIYDDGKNLFMKPMDGVVIR